MEKMAAFHKPHKWTASTADFCRDFGTSEFCGQCQFVRLQVREWRWQEPASSTAPANWLVQLLSFADFWHLSFRI